MLSDEPNPQARPNPAVRVRSCLGPAWKGTVQLTSLVSTVTNKHAWVPSQAICVQGYRLINLRFLFCFKYIFSFLFEIYIFLFRPYIDLTTQLIASVGAYINMNVLIYLCGQSNMHLGAYVPLYVVSRNVIYEVI